MTGTLRHTLLERAHDVEAPLLDLDAIVRDGERRVARRRTAWVGAAAAVAAGAAVLAPALLPSEEAVVREATFATAFSAHHPAYALGSRVHVDGRSFDVGRDVVALVQTSHGVVFTDGDGAVWSATGDEPPLQVGRTHARHPRLEADGRLAAWVEPAPDRVPVFAVLDQAQGSAVVRSSLAARAGSGLLRDERDPALVLAVDGDLVYVRDSRGLVAWDPVTDAQRVLGEVGGFTVDDVKAGLVAHVAPGRDEGDRYRVGATLGSGRVLPAWNGFALSPDGRYLVGESEPDVSAVFDTRSGAEVTATPSGHDFVAGYGWVDGDTYVAVGITATDEWDTSPVDLLTCDVGGACTTLGPGVGTVADGLVVPLGTSMDD